MRAGLTTHDSSFKNIHFVANDPLKLKNALNTCLISKTKNYSATFISKTFALGLYISTPLTIQHISTHNYSLHYNAKFHLAAQKDLQTISLQSIYYYLNHMVELYQTLPIVVSSLNL